MSGGQRQRLAIARTLAYDPDVILYDEPTSGLDAATGQQVARLIRSTHGAHPKTSIIVTHDYESLSPIADAIYLFDTDTHALREVEPVRWPGLREELRPQAPDDGQSPPAGAARRGGGAFRSLIRRLGNGLVVSSRALEETLLAPLRLVPIWKSPLWGMRYLLHYLRLVAGPSAWLYVAMAGAIIGFATTYFTFKFFPLKHYTESLVIEDILTALGFALYRILVPVLATVLIAARCGAAVASDIGGKVYGQQFDALRTFGVRPTRYLLTGVMYAFLIGAPLLVGVSYAAAAATSLTVFTAIKPTRGPEFWDLHYHADLRMPGEWLYGGSGWLLAKTLLCAAGIALIAYHRGALRQTLQQRSERRHHHHHSLGDAVRAGGTLRLCVLRV